MFTFPNPTAGLNETQLECRALAIREASARILEAEASPSPERAARRAFALAALDIPARRQAFDLAECHRLRARLAAA